MMLLTVIWPTNSPSYSTANGSCRPARAPLSIARTIAPKVRGRVSAPGGVVASQRESQPMLRCRTRRQSLRSPTAKGRRRNGPWLSTAGQPVLIGPIPRSVVAPDDLLHGVPQDRYDDLET